MFSVARVLRVLPCRYARSLSLLVVLGALLAPRPASAQLVEVSGQPNLGTVNLGSSISATFVFQAQSAIQTSSKAVAVTEGVKGLDFSVSSDNCNTLVQTGDSCQIVVSFTPTVAGLRLGTISKNYGFGTGLKVPIYGVGYGPQMAFGPPTGISIAPTVNGLSLGNPSLAYGIGGVAIDGAGDVFISDPYNTRVVKVPAGGGAATSVLPADESDQIPLPGVLAVDGSGNLYIGTPISSENSFGGSYVEVVLLGGQTGQIGPTVNGLGISYVSGLVIDGAGDLFIADCGNARVVEYSTTSEVATAIAPTVNGIPLSCANGLTIDNSGDLLIADSSNNRILQITNLGAGTASILDPGVGLDYPYGLAVDGAGNLFIAEPNINQVLEVPAGGGNAIEVGSSLNGPGSVVVDGVGDLFIADGRNDRVLELQRPIAPSAAFGTPTSDGATDTTDGTQTVQVVNIGNSPLTFSGVGYPADFAPATDANACTGSTVLAIDQECDIAVRFAPVFPSSGPLSESVTLTDDSLNGTGVTQSVGATGTAIGPVATHLSVSAPASVNAGQSFSVTVTALTAANLPAYSYTGTVTIASSDPAALLPASGSLSNGVGTFSVTLNSLYSQTVTATDAVNSLAGTSSGIVVGEGTGVAPVSAGTNFGSQPVGRTSTAQGVSFSIGAGTTVGSIAVMTAGSPNLDFANAGGSGSCTATTYSSATTCAIDVTFKPAFAGMRPGAVVFFSGLNNTGTVLASVPVYGVGTGPQIAFGTNQAIAIAPVVNGQPAYGLGVAVDGAGDLFIADEGNYRVVEVPAGGGAAIAIQASVNGENSFPYDVAIDGAGNLFIADLPNSRIVEVPVGGGAAFAIDPTVNGESLNRPYGVSTDAMGDLFIADYYNNRVVEVPNGGSAFAIDPTVNGDLLSGPVKAIVDAAGNLFISNSNNVVEVPAGGGPATLIAPTVNGQPMYFAEGLAVFWHFHNSLKELETAYTDYRICTVFCSCLFSPPVRLSLQHESASQISPPNR